MTSLAPTFLASLRAVGTAATMAGAGFYLHRRGFVTASGKKMMALLSQQVTIPAFLFAKIIYCPKNGSHSSTSGGGGVQSNIYNFTNRDLEEFSDADLDFMLGSQVMGESNFLPPAPHREIVCPSVADRISDLWMLLIWPFFVVSCGLVTGYFAAIISNTPPVQRRSCLAACAFGNSTGLVLTLLTVIHSQFGAETELGSIDPTAFLSVYLLLYPVLQWGVGGWLLAPDETAGREDKKESEKNDHGIVMTPTNGGGNGRTPQRGSNGSNGKIPRSIVAVTDHPLLAQNGANFNLPATQRNQSESDAHAPHHSRDHSYHIAHLLNYNTNGPYSPAIEAGDEEFGGVPVRRLVISSPSRHRRHFTTGRIESSNSLFTAIVPDWSSSNLKNMIHENENTPHSSPSPRCQLTTDNGEKQKGQEYVTKKRPSFLGHNDSLGDEPLTLEAGEDPALGPSTSNASLAKSSSTNSTNGAVPQTIDENVPLLSSSNLNSYSNENMNANELNVVTKQVEESPEIESDDVPLADTLIRIARKVFQPPVIGALTGLFIASFPNVRGILVNIWGDTNDGSSSFGKPAPLEWMFDGIHSVGEAAVPINMTILGINLSSTFQKKKPKIESGAGGMGDDSKSKLLSSETMIAVIIGKMVVMPALGIISTWFLQKYYVHFPDEIDATCYLVMMIVFITPTANNVMVMVELSGSSSKEGMARLIGWQYITAPVLLSFVLSAVVSLASGHFDNST
mmetsp:Transcript_1915/g.4180  ORF Transcript_1915/g.4180 Transcript_1915/m.4180 type:complete len:736 (-) Transcript_1915:70-2277(-)